MPPLAYNANTGLIMSEPSPFIMKSPKYGNVVTFDMSTDRPTQEQISYSPFFVTAQTLYYEKPSGQIGSFNIAHPGGGNGKTVLVNDIFKKVRAAAIPILGIPVGLLIFAAVFLFRVLSGLLFSILGLAINLLRTEKLNYSSILSVTLFASTAMTFLDIIKVTPFGGILATGFGNYVSIAVTAFYLFMGIKLTEEK